MEQEEDKKPPQWLMPNKVYDGLKWVGLIVCPAVAGRGGSSNGDHHRRHLHRRVHRHQRHG